MRAISDWRARATCCLNLSFLGELTAVERAVVAERGAVCQLAANRSAEWLQRETRDKHVEFRQQRNQTNELTSPAASHHPQSAFARHDVQSSREAQNCSDSAKAPGVSACAESRAKKRVTQAMRRRDCSAVVNSMMWMSALPDWQLNDFLREEKRGEPIFAFIAAEYAYMQQRSTS